MDSIQECFGIRINRQTLKNMNTSTREWCNCCNNYSPVSFHVPDEIWNEVTMGKFQRLCIMCFAKRADERLIDWAKDIQFFPFSLKNESNEIREALEELVHLHGCEQEGLQSGRPTPEQWLNAINKAHDALWPKSTDKP